MVLTNQYTDEAEAAIKKQRIREVQELVDKHSMSNKEIDSCLQSVRSNCTKEKPSSAILPDDADTPEGSQSKEIKAVDEEAKLVIDERPEDDEKTDLNKSIESDTKAARDADRAPVITNNIPDDETVAMTPSGSSTNDPEPMIADTLCQKFPKSTSVGASDYTGQPSNSTISARLSFMKRKHVHVALSNIIANYNEGLEKLSLDQLKKGHGTNSLMATRQEALINLMAEFKMSDIEKEDYKRRPCIKPQSFTM